MKLSETADKVNAFLDSYRVAFERLDAAAIADHFAYPSHITSDMGEIVLVPIPAKEDWTGEIEGLLGMYGAIGFRSAGVLNMALTEILPRLVQAVVHWELRDGEGGSLYDFQAIYTLAEIDGALRISAIAHNEIPRYRECLARLRSLGTLGGGSPEAPDR